MITEKPMKTIAAMLLLVIAAGCAQMPICPEVKLTLCPMQEARK